MCLGLTFSILFGPCKTRYYIIKLQAYLRSLGLSVGKKLLFFSLCLHVPKFFVQLLVYPVTVFCLGMSEIQLSHTCIQRVLCKDPSLEWGGGSLCHTSMAIISILVTRHYFHWFFFSFLSFDLIKIFLQVKGL